MKSDSNDKVKYGSVKELATSMAVYTSGSIFGPLIFFGLLGYFLDKQFNTKPFFIILSVLIAFVVTNIFLIKKIKHLMKEMDKQVGDGADNEKGKNDLSSNKEKEN